MPTDANPYQAPTLHAAGSPSRSGKLIVPEINGLRGIAILGVIFFHAFFVWFSKTTIFFLGFWVGPYIVSGWLGVNLFFVLSAFVLFLPYVASDRDIGAPGAIWAFYKHRALRLLPAYYLIIIAEMAFSGFSPFKSAFNARETLAVFSFTFSFMPDMWIPAAVNLSAWSLGTEVLFSAVFPFLCWLCLRFGAARVLAVSIPVGCLFRFLGFAFGNAEAVSWMEGMLIGRIDEFLWGFLLAEMFVRGRIPKRPRLLWFLGFIVLTFVQRAYPHVGDDPALRYVYRAGLVVALDVAIVLLVAAALAGRSWWSDFLNMRWLRVIGMACYSLYLWHYPLLYPLHVPPDPFNVSNLAAYLMLLAFLSAMTYRFVEFRNVADWRSLFLIHEVRRLPLDAIVDPAHPLAGLASRVDWRFLEHRFGAAYIDRPGQPPLPARLMAGLAILQHMHGLSDESVCDQWLENPYYQWFCGEEYFHHTSPFDRSALPRWRRHVGEETVAAELRESLCRAGPMPDGPVDRGRDDMPALESVRLV